MRAVNPAMLASLLLAACAPQSPPETAAVTPVRYVCDRSQAISVAFDRDRALLDTGQRKYSLKQRRVASGYAYAGEGHAIRGKEHELVWSAPGGASFSCREETWAMRQPQIQPPEPVLAGSSWTLVSFQSSDDAIGTVTPANPERYTLAFDPGGRLAMQLDCNRGMGSWQVTAQNPHGGTLQVKGGAMTRAACLPGSMDTRIASDLARIRSFTIKDDRLFLALEADAGVYQFRRN